MNPTTQRASAYLAQVPVSIQGQGGRDALFVAAAALVRGFALTEDDALPLLSQWNTGCLPPWTERDLRQTLRSAARSSSRPSGYLLGESSSSSRPRVRGYGPSSPKPPAVRSQKLEVPTAEALAEAEADAEKKARLRSAWPDFHPLTHAHITTIAEQRHMLPDAVDLAHRWGFMKSACVDGIDCFILQEGRFAQARRLDGKPFIRPDGTPIKSKNLAGSEGAFIGRRWLGNTQNVLLVEGVVGLLEALAALALVNTSESWSILAATSASSRFARDPQLLHSLQGRHVRIVPDADDTGLKAATIWQADLDQAKVKVSIRGLPPGYHDLGPLVTAETALSGTHAPLLQALFA